MTTHTQSEAKSTSTPIPAMQLAHSGLLPQQEQEEPARSSLSSEDRLRSPSSPTPPPINPSAGHSFGPMAIGPTTSPVLQRMAIANKNLIQRQDNTEEEEKEEEEPIQTKAIASLSVPSIQRQMSMEEEKNNEEEPVQMKAIAPHRSAIAGWSYAKAIRTRGDRALRQLDAIVGADYNLSAIAPRRSGIARRRLG